MNLLKPFYNLMNNFILRYRGIDRNHARIDGLLYVYGRADVKIGDNVRIISERRTNPLGGGNKNCVCAQ